MALHTDLPAMYDDIDQVYPLWRFSLVQKTEQDVARNKHQGYFPLMWLANFSSLRDKFEKALKVICMAPHSRLQVHTTNLKAVKLKGRINHNLGEKVKQDFKSNHYDKRYQVEKKILSVDTHENRFIKMVVNQTKLKLSKFENKLCNTIDSTEQQRVSESFVGVLHSWQKPLQKMLKQSFMKDVGEYRGTRKESLVLQQKTGYDSVYRIWQDLKFYLDVFGSNSSISMKSVAEIYEIWCFLCIKQILETNLDFDMVDSHKSPLELNDYFEYKMKDGFAGAFKFKRSDGVTARLAHEPKFTKTTKDIRSYVINQEPDIVLEITIPASNKHSKDKEV